MKNREARQAGVFLYCSGGMVHRRALPELYYRWAPLRSKSSFAMSSHDVEKIVCRRCFAVLDAGDNFCRRCGAATTGSAAASPGLVPQPATPRSKLGDNRGVVLLLLFAVLGPLAIPTLWRSSRFSLTWKIVLTAIVLGITVAIIGVLWYVVVIALKPLRELQQFRL